MDTAGRGADDDLKIGLPLGGGAAQGFAHVAVLEALDELGLRPKAIAATSMGAVIGAAYAAGMSGSQIRTYATGLFQNRARFVGHLWQLRPRRVKEISIGFGQYDLERVLDAFLPPGLPDDVDDLPIAFKTVATDYYSGNEAVLDRGPLTSAIAASAAVPMLFRPIMNNGRILVDGGLCNPVPFDLLDDVDFTIASDVVTEPGGDALEVPGAVESLFGVASLLMRSILIEKLKAGSGPDVLIRLPTTASHILDFTKAATIMEESEIVKDSVKRRLEEALGSRTRVYGNS
ncbi:MAG: patatin-like phospholipase family protein [Hyphomicrobiales bacterium]|nr:patatin-like phospholipase family protein [Hyphomicrobiales bacterium]